MKYKAKKQAGEMSYNQPIFPVVVTEDDVEKGLFEHAWIYGIVEVLEVGRKYERQALLQGFRLLYEGVNTIAISPISDSDTGLLYRKKPVTILNKFKLVKIQVHCFTDAAAVANYFKDRLPQAFYDKYLGFAIEEIN